MITPITLNGNAVSLVSFPSAPGLRSVEFSFTDSVAIVTSIFTGQVQAQQWVGADQWTGTLTLPPLTQTQADRWIAFLMELRGMLNPFQLGDPLKPTPRGSGKGIPVVDTAGNVTGAQALLSRGWPANAWGLLMDGDYIQVGYRFHRVVNRVNSDGAGKASIAIWPSLREAPADGQAIILNSPKGLFRLASNKRTWSTDVTRYSSISFQIQEYR